MASTKDTVHMPAARGATLRAHSEALAARERHPLADLDTSPSVDVPQHHHPTPLAPMAAVPLPGRPAAPPVPPAPDPDMHDELAAADSDSARITILARHLGTSLAEMQAARADLRAATRELTAVAVNVKAAAGQSLEAVHIARGADEKAEASSQRVSAVEVLLDEELPTPVEGRPKSSPSHHMVAQGAASSDALALANQEIERLKHQLANAAKGATAHGRQLAELTAANERAEKLLAELRRVVEQLEKLVAALSKRFGWLSALFILGGLIAQLWLSKHGSK